MGKSNSISTLGHIYLFYVRHRTIGRCHVRVRYRTVRAKRTAIWSPVSAEVGSSCLVYMYRKSTVRTGRKCVDHAVGSRLLSILACSYMYMYVHVLRPPYGYVPYACACRELASFGARRRGVFYFKFCITMYPILSIKSQLPAIPVTN